MFALIADDDMPRLVALMNRAFRGSAGQSTEVAYLSGDRTTEALLRADLLANPQASLLEWAQPPERTLLGCVWLEPLSDHTCHLGSVTTDLIDRELASEIRCCPSPNNECANKVERAFG